MNVMIVSQCTKRALTETRRILDQFAERKGERVWQTAITQEGLNTLRRNLRKTAKKNTAIACHWIKSGDRTELLWIVGNAMMFNENGSVPTNTTGRDMLRTWFENQWHTAEDIALLAGIAGLFHDFGKANSLFQKKLKSIKNAYTAEPYRHEWISLRLFEAFVGETEDREWLNRLARTGELEEQYFLTALIKDNATQSGNPFKTIQSPFARAIGWLILSHHRLPKWDRTRDGSNAPRLKQIDGWMISNKFGPDWNSPQCKHADWSPKDFKAVWNFPAGIPLRSNSWQSRARKLAVRALKRFDSQGKSIDWMADRFTMHLARMILMLSDHYYSGHDAKPEWQDERYKAYANSDRETRSVKQKLDEHSVGVALNASVIARTLPHLRKTLPSITRHRGFRKRSRDPRFRWQDKAYELARGIKNRTFKQGFFGVNMASTGCGKTFANGRIMYGLADEKAGCRFSVGLGLRTLTLQTGDALRERLNLDDDDLAVLIGSQSIRQLHEFKSNAETLYGSESSEDLFSESQHVRYEGALDNGRIGKWLQRTPKLHQLVSAPILVSTIDHLISATESERGGRQIAPMLRLLTSDLVLDEPDDFNLDDMPALCRLVNWAGMLGSRILLSSATLPPALVYALFEAYREGRRAYQVSCGVPGTPLNICCAWFDEYRVAQSDHCALETFSKAHQHFVSKRVSDLKNIEPIRRGILAPVETSARDPSSAIRSIADVVYENMHRLHASHCQRDPASEKCVSFGLMRMANISQLVATAEQLFSLSPRQNHRIHYCVYHSQHPLAIRASIERMLDTLLKRHDPEMIWRQPEIRKVLLEHPESNHLFVVLATPVAEIGRDHDYDWAIAEPSSMRSIIQLAGRVQRHRYQVRDKANLIILSSNYNGLMGKEIAFTKPGFESLDFPLHSHNLKELLEKEQYQVVTSIPRIVLRDPMKPNDNLADLEHEHIRAKMFGSEQPEIRQYAALWWQHNAHWSYELQRRSRFRWSAPDIEYVLYADEDEDTPEFHLVNDRGELVRCEKVFVRTSPVMAKGNSLWGDHDLQRILAELLEAMDMDIAQASRRFATLRLSEADHRWFYNRALGVYRPLGKARCAQV